MLHSCLIARNLLPGLKTCLEVSTYMNHDAAAMSEGSTAVSNSFFDGDGNIDANKLVCVSGFEPHFLISICSLKTNNRKKATWMTHQIFLVSERESSSFFSFTLHCPTIEVT